MQGKHEIAGKDVAVISAREQSGFTGGQLAKVVAAPTEFGRFDALTSVLLRVPKRAVTEQLEPAATTRSQSRGRAMTREIELSPTESDGLRRAREQAREGHMIDQAELDKRIADQG